MILFLKFCLMIDDLVFLKKNSNENWKAKMDNEMLKIYKCTTTFRGDFARN